MSEAPREYHHGDAGRGLAACVTALAGIPTALAHQAASLSGEIDKAPLDVIAEAVEGEMQSPMTLALMHLVEEHRQAIEAVHDLVKTVAKRTAELRGG